MSQGQVQRFKVMSLVEATRCRDLQKVLVGMESTGCYHLNLFSFLTSQGIHVVVIYPENFADVRRWAICNFHVASNEDFATLASPSSCRK